MGVRSNVPFRILSHLLVAAVAVVATACGGGGDTAEKKPAITGTTPEKVIPAGPVVANVGDDVITAAEVKARLDEQSVFLKERYKDPKNRLSFVDNLVRHELLAQEAFRRGLDKDPEVQSTIKKILVQEMIKRAFDEKSITYSEEELKDYYDKRIADFVKPERVRVLHLFVSAPEGDAAKRAAGKKKANDLLTKIRANETKADVKHPQHATYSTTLFGELARENSDDPTTKATGGDLRYRSKEDLERLFGSEFANAAFSLQKLNQVSGVVETPRGFHVAKLVQRQAAVDRKFDDPSVQQSIKDRLYREQRTKAFDTFVQELREKANVRIDEEVLAAIEIEASAPVPVGTPGAPRPVADTNAQ